LSVGGGRIILKACNFSVFGGIFAGGSPTGTNIIDGKGGISIILIKINLVGGSGGYIYIEQNKSDGCNSTSFQGVVRADGGKGYNSGGSGGRIVFDVLTSAFNSSVSTIDQNNPRISALGGFNSSSSIF
jgi:hypothetical protein